MSDADLQRHAQALISAYRDHTGPPPGAEARLLAAVHRARHARHDPHDPQAMDAQPMSLAPGPSGHVPGDSPMLALLRRRPWRAGFGLLAAAAVIAAVAVGVGVGERQARERDPAAAFHGAPETSDVATPRPDLRIPEAPPRATVPDVTGTTELAPSPTREPVTRPRREPPAPARTLADEMRRMRPAQRALAAGDPVTALAELERYALEFPDGHLREEYLAMHAIARCDAGHDEGPREAAEFLRARPLSIFAGRVRSACASP